MADPYRVLGIDPTASDEEVKNAYHNLARKYHPDNFSNDATAKELAEERMKEINEAYNTITTNRKNNRTNFGGAGNTSNDYSSNREKYIAVREHINSGRIMEAQQILQTIPMTERNAEWYYLSGCVCASMGRYFDAQNFFTRACTLDPSNAEYRNALNNMQNVGGTFYNRTPGQNNAGCSGCDICSSLLCADCCCECMGGDLIPCC